MDFNSTKCKVLKIPKKKTLSSTVRTDGRKLECVSSISDLSITISNDLPWSMHIEVTVSKANKTLGLLKRVCLDVRDSSIRKLLYCALVQPKQRLGRQNRHMGLWPLGFQSYGPFLKSMGHYSNGVGQKKSIIQYHEVDIIIK